MSYTIILSKSVQKQIDSLPNDLISRIIQKLDILKTEPRPSGVVKLRGSHNEYRLRIGNYRIRYEIDDTNQTLKILQCKHRRDVYR